MDSIVNSLVQNIEQETEHCRSLNLAFVRIACIFEMHFQKRHSTLLEVCPELEGYQFEQNEIEKIKASLKKFVEENPSHPNVCSALGSLVLTRDPGLKEFYLSILKLNFQWKISANVFHAMLALESLGEKIFYTIEGQFIGSRGSHDMDNFLIAERYLNKLGKGKTS